MKKQQTNSISVEWSKILRTDISFSEIFLTCLTTEKGRQTPLKTEIDLRASQFIIHQYFICGKKELSSHHIVLSPNRQTITLSTTKLLGGGCSAYKKTQTIEENKHAQPLSIKFDQSREAQKFTTSVSSQKKVVTETSRLDQIWNDEIQQNQGIVNLDQNLIPSLQRILEMDFLDWNVSRFLQKILMQCIEFLLENYRVSSNTCLTKINLSSLKKLKSYVKKIKLLVQFQKETFPLRFHLIFLDWLQRILNLNKSDQSFIASNFQQCDCQLFSLQPEIKSENQVYIQEQNQNYLLLHKNSIFHLIGYKRQVQTNFMNCQGNLQHYSDQLLFSHHQAFIKLKQVLSFDARLYALFTIDLVILYFSNHCLDQMKDIMPINLQSVPPSNFIDDKNKQCNLKNQNIQNNILPSNFHHIPKDIPKIDINNSYSDNQQDPKYPVNVSSVYINTFLFSLNEGMIQLCRDEFKLNANSQDNENAKTFMAKHQILKYIASQILKSIFFLLQNVLPSSSNNLQQLELLKKLINYRISQEISPIVKVLFLQSNFPEFYL